MTKIYDRCGGQHMRLTRYLHMGIWMKDFFLEGFLHGTWHDKKDKIWQKSIKKHILTSECGAKLVENIQHMFKNNCNKLISDSQRFRGCKAYYNFLHRDVNVVHFWWSILGQPSIDWVSLKTSILIAMLKKSHKNTKFPHGP